MRFGEWTTGVSAVATGIRPLRYSVTSLYGILSALAARSIPPRAPHSWDILNSGVDQRDAAQPSPSAVVDADLVANEVVSQTLWRLREGEGLGPGRDRERGEVGSERATGGGCRGGKSGIVAGGRAGTM